MSPVLLELPQRLAARLRSWPNAVGLSILCALWLGPASLLAAEARDQHGQSHLWRGVVGQLTVIDFAASWCAPCRISLPKLQAFAEGHPDLRVLVVSVDDEVAGRNRLVQSLGLRLPVLWDEDYAIAEHYQPRAMPATVAIDAEGKEVFRATGSGQKEWDAFLAFVQARLRPPA